ncbi:TetR/AcrR family transcriptional regulator [Actinomadura namibiensis]|uniref:AcrR family transcriptional regulator n=1 Tax=Actinomadura namibiensis TaxID=182080 RepID=A0A7W3QMM5_ACTNM|nr:TetR/AcrR family transcriptional regulator [Actinomadura namibiensis]MBA8952661.1 AcrR family transcriptional regulator [Actinomadura namibiensis]
MARTVDQAAHATRRRQILDVAQRLVETRGYEQMSVQDVLDELGMSKGALYHYFGSKQALLAGIVDRTADQIEEHLAEVVETPGSDALGKLNQIFQALAGWKAGHRDRLVALLRVWNSDGNALTRHRTRAGIAERLAPLFERVVEQGVRDGVFTLPTAVGFGQVLVSLVQDLNERLGDLFFACEEGRADPSAVDRTVAAYTAALERILGVAPGAVHIVDPSALHAWFDPPRQEREG